MTDAQNPMRLPWRAGGRVVLNCDDYFIANADTMREAATIIHAVNHHDALVEMLQILLGGDPKLQIMIGGNPNYIDAFIAKARALLTKIEGEG